jgi:CubicO group peptidase (beta-lactamase class C family)
MHASVVIARGDRIELRKAYGPGAAPSSEYDVGSVAKSFTAVAVLRLVEAGRLRLGDRVSRFFAHVPQRHAAATVAELLTHTAGFPAYFSSDQERLSMPEAVRRILATRASLRGRFLYSDAGYTLLAAIVQTVAHVPFERFVRTELLQVAGLAQTGFFGDPDVRGASRAHGFANARDRGAAGTQAPLSWSIIGAGGMLATAADLYRWVRALETGRIVDARLRAAMWTGHAAIPGPGVPRAGYGWVVGRDPAGRRVIAVGGGTDFGFTADLRLYPQTRTVTAVLSATDRHPAAELARLVAVTLGL